MEPPQDAPRNAGVHANCRVQEPRMTRPSRRQPGAKSAPAIVNSDTPDRRRFARIRKFSGTAWQFLPAHVESWLEFFVAVAASPIVTTHASQPDSAQGRGADIAPERFGRQPSDLSARAIRAGSPLFQELQQRHDRCFDAGLDGGLG